MLIRRCPYCKSTRLSEKRVAGRRGHGGFYYGLVCSRCRRVLERFEVVNQETGELIASAADEGEYRHVDWHKKSKDNADRLGGRDEEGMAI